MTQISEQDFLIQLRQTSPDYVEMEDHVLMQAVLNKYPVYKEQVQLSETTLDALETAQRPEFAALAGNIAVGAYKEARDTFKLIRGADKAIGNSLVDFTKNIAKGDFEEVGDQVKRVGKGLSTALKLTPGLLKEAVIDSGRTFGKEPGRDFDLDVTLNKIQRAPIQSALDVFLLTSIAKAVAKGGFSALTKAFAKKDFKKVISKQDMITAELHRQFTRSVDDPVSKLYDQAPTLKKLTIQQLDSTEFAGEIAKDAVMNIRKMSRNDKAKLAREIRKIKDFPMNKRNIQASFRQELKKEGLLGEKGEILISKIEEDRFFKAELKRVKPGSDPRPIRAGELHQRMKILDRRINYNTKDPLDGGKQALRRAYRSELRRSSPGYDETAILVAEKLDKFGDTIRKVEKLGADEKLGKGLLGTEEELKAFRDLLRKSPDPRAARAEANLNIFDTIAEWNAYFDQNGELFSRVVFNVGPIRESTTLAPFLKFFHKRVIKGRIKTGTAPRRFKKASGFVQHRQRQMEAFLGRGALESLDIQEEAQ